MNDIIQTKNLQFHDREIFLRAVDIVHNIERMTGENLFDVGYADMVMAVYSDIGLEFCLEELATHKITNKQSFRGIPDFEIVE